MAEVSRLALLASAARTQTTTGDAFNAASINRPYVNSTGYQRGALFSLDITTSSGTSPTLEVAIQGRVNAGTWITIPDLQFQVVTISAALGEFVAYPYPLPAELRAMATIGGTTPSFTFEVNASAIG